MAYRPAASLDEYSDLDLALMVLLNVFGYGTKRKTALGSRYSSVQTIVNVIVSSNKIPSLPSGPTDIERVREVLEAFRPTDIDYDEFMMEFLNALKEEK